MSLPLLTSSINLPWFITLHALWLTVLGLHFTFTPVLTHLFSSSSSVNTSSNKDIRPPPSSASKQSKKQPRQTASLGIATLGLGLAYLSTAYVEIEKNQFLYASVPVRIILGAVAGVRLLLSSVIGKGSTGGEKDRVAKEEDKEAGPLLFVLLYDALGGCVLGWWLGEGGFGGRPPVY